MLPLLAVLAVLGLLLARDSLRLSRWQPEQFREGPVVFRESRALAVVPAVLPTPEVSTGLFYDTEYWSLGPTEVAFTAQTFNGPLLLGLLEVDPARSTLTATGRLHWTAWAIALLACALTGSSWTAYAVVLALGAVNYATEVRSLRRVLDRVADAVNRGPDVEPPAPSLDSWDEEPS
jgi:hypothetical protein